MNNLYNMQVASEIDGRLRQVDTSLIDRKEVLYALSIGIAQLVHEGKLKSDDICVDD